MEQQSTRSPSPRRRTTTLTVTTAAVTAVVLFASSACADQFKSRWHGAPAGDGGSAAQGSGTGRTAADGYVPDGQPLSPYDIEPPAIANLDPELRAAIQRAATDARADGVTIMINSGWRSARYQQMLLDEAIATYGSEAEARTWVSTPDRSKHVTGKAVDVGPTDATSWLSQHGADYGLCQVYANERWHYELSVRPGGTCPPQIRDASTG
ncbi:M15 family metallopeptidase [Plantactinospora sp. GCM10030261]|uniref:M15 family metallopeptidase n=1 Tax=Plantactinospora sp. GCM10030261 TaxID=3273420 RepID=UPI00360A7B39